jgi:glycosyltransferase involved in cell wall biosynthesis
MKRPLLSPTLDQRDEAAISAFRSRYGSARLGPVAVVIAAYEEEVSIGGVLDELPVEACGLSVSRIVVVDGGNDRTESVAAAHGAYVCPLAQNRGQGAALRLGYALARESGARFIVTTDADGQYVGNDIEALLRPLVAGPAGDNGPDPQVGLSILCAAREPAYRPAYHGHVVRPPGDDGGVERIRDAATAAVSVGRTPHGGARQRIPFR